MKRILISGLLVALLGSISNAAPIINVGNFLLQPNQAGQTIQIFVSGGDVVQGLDFNAQIADGGPGPDTMGSIDGPDITDANIVTGTIFNGNNTGNNDPGSYPQLAIRATTTNTGTVAASGLLATLTIDTTGFFNGTYPLLLSNTLNGNTMFSGPGGPVQALITNGSITVPEPSSMVLAGIGFCAWVGLSSRRKKLQSIA